ncbi:MAG TPA: CocE/NonD family hydrolase [Kiritimatiellia bacterium]|nr:CocE/NonD family hydrolase [Kiritimatiellia bacterium]
MMRTPHLLLLALLTGGARAATDPATDGPFGWAVQSPGIGGTQGEVLRTDVYYPGAANQPVNPAAGPCPVIVLGHGFAQSKARHVNQGRQLATRGFIVMIPEFNGFSDHARNGEDMRRCIDWITAQHANPSSLFFGAVDTNAIGVTGHSAGGLSAILAAAADARIKAVSVMDPVDSGGQGVAALPSVTVPIAMTWSESSSCNAFGSAPTLYAAAQGIRRGIKIVGANHSDPQDPVGVLSAITCGAANAARQALYRRYMAGWFEYFLRGDETYAPWVFRYTDGPLEQDRLAGRITYAAVSPLRLEIQTGPLVNVEGPLGQPFDLDHSPDGSSWAFAGSYTNPGPVTNLPDAPTLWLRALSR